MSNKLNTIGYILNIVIFCLATALSSLQIKILAFDHIAIESTTSFSLFLYLSFVTLVIFALVSSISNFIFRKNELTLRQMFYNFNHILILFVIMYSVASFGRFIFSSIPTINLEFDFLRKELILQHIAIILFIFFNLYNSSIIFLEINKKLKSNGSK